MAIQGSYRINFTDPKNGSFVIEPYTVNGNVTPTSDMLHGKATRANTSLQLPGQYVPNYGELVHENLVHLLENFAGDTPPEASTEGQLWYDTGDSYPIVDISTAGCTVSGNHSAEFSVYISSGATLNAWYGPVSTTDNSYNSIQFKVTSVSVTGANTTVLTISKVDGTALTLPNTAVGGFVTVSQSSRIGRMKVALKVSGTLTWADVVNVQCSALTPTREYIQSGDLWYDTTAKLLKMYIDGAWLAITGKYLPLAGGTMTGPLVMGTNAVTFSGAVSSGTTLTNKTYVDTAIATAIAPLQSGTDIALGDLEDRVDGVVTSVATVDLRVNDANSRIDDVTALFPAKVNRSGDVITGVLIFGPDGTTSTAPAGIDMNNRPIVNPSITWSAGDYLDATGETHNAIDKKYLALALKQHLLDAVHGQAAFIDRQDDGTGLITDSLYFGAASNTLSFKIGTDVYSFGVDGSSFVISTGSFLGSKISFRKAGSSASLFEVGDTASRSYNSLYLFDGQPQPTFSGAVTASNEDTKAATKGFVLASIATNNDDVQPITSATFASTLPNGPYTLSLLKDSGDPVTVDINHKHQSSRIVHTYEALTPSTWTSGTTDLVGQSFGSPVTVDTDRMLNALNRYKAPTSGAKFTDAPLVGSDDTVTSIRDSDSSLTLAQGNSTPLVVGAEISLTWTTVTVGPPSTSVVTTNTYTITQVVQETDEATGFSTYHFVTSPALPVGHDLVAKPMTVQVPVMDDNADRRRLLNRASVDKLVHDYTASYVASHRFKPVVSNTATALTLELTHLGQYLRMNNAAATAITVPPVATVAWTIGTEIEIRNAGAGKVTLTAGTDVTLNAPFGCTLVMQGKGANAKIKYVAANQWDVSGNFEAVVTP